MSEKTYSFIESLDYLVDLLKQLKEKIIRETVDQLDDSFSKNLDMIVKNYNVIRNDYSKELTEQFSEPVKKMVYQLIDQVSDELEEINERNTKVMGDLRRIDQLLGSDNLPIEEMDRLLDKRSELLPKMSRTANNPEDQK